MSKASTIKGEACRFFHGLLKALRRPEQASLRVREGTDQPRAVGARAVVAMVVGETVVEAMAVAAIAVEVRGGR